MAVTHDPREAVYLGRRIVLLGKPGQGVVLDEGVDLAPEERRYGSPRMALIEERLVRALEMSTD
jgi:NitT/TauT family transport system ATP-binding protein